MPRKTPIDQLTEAISGILNAYADQIDQNVGEIAVQMGKKGVQALRKESRGTFPNGSGEYAKGWKSQVDRERLSTTVTIYNDHYSLPHLLEHGHVIRNGTGRDYGDVRAREHIKPVEEKLVETFEREVMSKL